MTSPARGARQWCHCSVSGISRHPMSTAPGISGNRKAEGTGDRKGRARPSLRLAASLEAPNPHRLVLQRTAPPDDSGNVQARNALMAAPIDAEVFRHRSEERRVGKEGRTVMSRL